MSRKHFIALAAAIAQITDKNERLAIARVVAGVCRAQNDRFDSRRFEDACKLEGGSL